MHKFQLVKQYASPDRSAEGDPASANDYQGEQAAGTEADTQTESEAEVMAEATDVERDVESDVKHQGDSNVVSAEVTLTV